jgi:hypothetical protein
MTTTVCEQLLDGVIGSGGLDLLDVEDVDRLAADVRDVTELRFPDRTEVSTRPVVILVSRAGVPIVPLDDVALADVGVVIPVQRHLVSVVGEGDPPPIPRDPLDEHGTRIGTRPRSVRSSRSVSKSSGVTVAHPRCTRDRRGE